jgi:hypothetical protein
MNYLNGDGFSWLTGPANKPERTLADKWLKLYGIHGFDPGNSKFKPWLFFYHYFNKFSAM